MAKDILGANWLDVRYVRFEHLKMVPKDDTDSVRANCHTMYPNVNEPLDHPIIPSCSLSMPETINNDILVNLFMISIEESPTCWKSAKDRFLLAWATAFIASTSRPLYLSANLTDINALTSSGLKSEKTCPYSNHQFIRQTYAFIITFDNNIYLRAVKPLLLLIWS